MVTRLLTIAALVGAPFLCIGVYVEAEFPQWVQPWWTGVWGLLYITGWLAGMEAMRRLKLAGEDSLGQWAVGLVMITLLLADISNVWQLLAPDYKPFLFWALDIFWPVSHVLMLGVGIATIRAKKLGKYQSWLPIVMGLWFPMTIAVSRTPIVLHFSNIYSLICWTGMAAIIWQQARIANRKSVSDIEVASQRSFSKTLQEQE